MKRSYNINAAEKKDVVGEWAGGWASVTFDEDGNATDAWNSRAYHMESGSLTVKYDSGITETVD